MCITPASSFAQTSSAGSHPNPLLASPGSFSLLRLPAYLPGFCYGSTVLAPSEGAGTFDCTFAGWLDPVSHDRTCPHCGRRMNIKSQSTVLLRHVPVGHWHTFIQVNLKQFECPYCGKTHVQ